MSPDTGRRVAFLSFLLLQAALGCRQPAHPALPTPTGGDPQRGGQVIVATTADVTTFNEYQSTGEQGEADAIDLLFPSLMTEQPDYQLHPPSFAPRLATSWEFSSDNQTLTFHLRPEARWSDGVPVTAEDVRFTFLAQKDPRVGSLGMEMKDFIRDVEVVDPHTVRFQFTRVYPYQLMDANDGHIVPAHVWGKVPFERWHTTDFEKILVTAGPFRLAAHTPQQTIILERDPGYWGSPRPYLDRLVLRVVPDMASQLSQLFAGQVNVVQAVSPQEVERVLANRDLNLVEFPSRMWGMVGWNNRRPMFADRRVRRALALGINRKSLVDTVFRGHATPSVGPVLSSMWAYNRNLPQLPYAPDQAALLLAQAGWRDSQGVWTPRGGIWLSDDDLVVIGPELYEEFVVPCYSRIFTTFGGGHLHFCGNGAHQAANIRKIEGLTAVNNSPMYGFESFSKLVTALNRTLTIELQDAAPIDPGYYKKLFGCLGSLDGVMVTTFVEDSLGMSEQGASVPVTWDRFAQANAIVRGVRNAARAFLGGAA